MTDQFPMGTPSTPREFCAWLIRLDDPEDIAAREARRTITLTRIVETARTVLVGTDAPHEALGITVDREPENLSYVELLTRAADILADERLHAPDDQGSMLVALSGPLVRWLRIEAKRVTEWGQSPDLNAQQGDIAAREARDFAIAVCDAYGARTPEAFEGSGS